MDSMEKLSSENSWFEEHITERLKSAFERIESLENKVNELDQEQREQSLIKTQERYLRNH
jgi:hypothetical protein